MHNPGTHSGQHLSGFITNVSLKPQFGGNGHSMSEQSESSTHISQHWPAGLIIFSPIPHDGNGHAIPEQFGVQNGSVNSNGSQNLAVQIVSPSIPQLHVLQPSKNPPFGHVSHEIHSGCSITGIVIGDGVGNWHNPGWHWPQHSPGGTTIISSGPHSRFKHIVAEQSGLQNGWPGSAQNFSVHIGLPLTHLQSLHPSL